MLLPYRPLCPRPGGLTCDSMYKCTKWPYTISACLIRESREIHFCDILGVSISSMHAYLLVCTLHALSIISTFIWHKLPCMFHACLVYQYIVLLIYNTGHVYWSLVSSLHKEELSSIKDLIKCINTVSSIFFFSKRYCSKYSCYKHRYSHKTATLWLMSIDVSHQV